MSRQPHRNGHASTTDDPQAVVSAAFSFSSTERFGSPGCNKDPKLCRANDNPRLPRQARLPINRCNLPADILGGLSFQLAPAPLHIDGVRELHVRLFATLDALASPAARAACFEDYLTVHFRLAHPDELGLTPSARVDRHKATWLRILRGWLFDSSSVDAAVLKAWVESRFGLLPRFHRAALRHPGDDAWRLYEEDRSRGLYGTAAIEAQFDLLFAFTQYEFARRAAPATLTLYRGVNRSDGYEALGAAGDSEIWLLNNLNSFSAARERAGEFGDQVIRARVPSAKVFFHSGVLPSRLQGEEEYLVLGGLYRIERVR